MNNDPYRPPSFESTPPSSIENASNLPLASRWQRFCATTLDSITVFGPLLLFAFFSPFESINGFILSESKLDEALFSLIGFVIFLVFNFHLIRTQGQTIGKLALGIKVTNLDGTQSPASHQMGLRYSFYYLITAIPGAGPLLSLIDTLFIFGAERRCLHDRIAGTQVVKCR